MERNKGFVPILVVLIIAAVGVIGFVIGKQLSLPKTESPSPTAMPTATPTPTNPNQPQITTPVSGSNVTSPLTVKGKVPTGWLFEGQLSIKLFDDNRNEIAMGTGYETVPGSWLSENAVDFEGTITFTTSAKTGFLVIGADNPSGLPENAKSFEIPIKF